MERIAEFKKVSLEKYKEVLLSEFGYEEDEARKIYENISIPKRATSGSAGYDFYAPFDIVLKPGDTIKIPTGIRARMEEGWVLMLFPRSGLGFKYRLVLDNTVGVIDSDYFHSDNEGHIMIKVTNCSGFGKSSLGAAKSEGKILEIKAGQGFAQGVFLPFGITADDEAVNVRNGGFGSTGM